MKLRIKKNPLLLAWIDKKGNIQYMSNMTDEQKKLLKKILDEEAKNEKI
jgi:phosphoserine aminotransferase